MAYLAWKCEPILPSRNSDFFSLRLGLAQAQNQKLPLKVEAHRDDGHVVPVGVRDRDGGLVHREVQEVEEDLGGGDAGHSGLTKKSFRVKISGKNG